MYTATCSVMGKQTFVGSNP